MPKGTIKENTPGTVRVSIPFKVKRLRGLNTVLVPDTPEAWKARTLPTPPQDTLVIAVLRAYRWQELLDRGTVGNVRELAKFVKYEEPYVHRVLGLAGMGPLVVEAILGGEEPDGLSLEGLFKVGVPVEWVQ